MYMGQMLWFAGEELPASGWGRCDGSLLDIATHTPLFSVFGTTYGGDGVSTFGLPKREPLVVGVEAYIAIGGKFPEREQPGTAPAWTPIVGHVMLFAGSFAPAGWLACDGARHDGKDYAALLGVIGGKFGGDGKTTFATPKPTPPAKGTRYVICATGQSPAQATPGDF